MAVAVMAVVTVVVTGGGHGGHFGGGHGFGHAHFGGGHHGGGGFARSHSFGHGGFHGHHAFAGDMAGANFGQIRNAAVGTRKCPQRDEFAVAQPAHCATAALLSNPAARAQIAAAAAHGGLAWRRRANGWWQHAGGGYGWVGPLFWPFAYHDIYDYTIWGDGIGFWDYGYPDIYAGIFAPYGYDDLAGYLPQRPSGRSHAQVRAVGADVRQRQPRYRRPADRSDRGRPFSRPKRKARALDELGNASIAAAQTIRAACPTQVILTAPGRLAAMQQRIEAMISAVATVRPPLEKFYGLLDDEQKARLNALAEDQRKSSPPRNMPRAPLAQNCGAAQPAAVEWPASEIEARLHPNDTQRAALQALQDASAEAAEMLKAACQADDAMTPPARLAAIGKRLDTMLQAVKLVRAALEDFYATLSDEQKAQFEAIGPRRSA